MKTLFLILMFAIAASANLHRNGKIAFTSDRDGNREIYVMNADGTNQTRLTNNAIVDDYPAWSPNGTKIAFASQKPSGDYAIFRMDADGTNRVEITPLQTDPGFPSISWSPDGSRIAFNDGITIFTVNPDGSERHTLRSGSFGSAWSPDGSKILFVDPDGALATIKPDGTDFQYLPGEGNVSYARWSPGGNKMVYVYDNMFSEQDISIADADGRNRERFDGGFCPCSFYRFAPSFSPDGRKIVFALHSEFDPTKEIVVKNVDGTGYLQLTSGVGRNTNPSWQPLASTNTPFDFDGDGRSDISVFRPNDSTWYFNRSTNGFSAIKFGHSTDKLTPGDFDGDGSTDIAVFRDGVWWRMNSSDHVVFAVQFGVAGDLPVPADYTGDGRDELAVYRNGVWWMYDFSTDHTSVVNFGLSNDKPVPADFDGDGRIDQAIYRNGQWHLNRSSLGYTVVQFGILTDSPVVGDYDGDGKADFGVYRDGIWYIQQSTSGFRAFQWGISTDIPAPADYDGDGKTDAAVFRNGTWYSLHGSNGVSIQQFGLAGDKPIPSAYSP
ncbi:MAG: hypothetical protein DMF63_11095 [Acidobacteria bacterium]|nr:MAG: hypothetical protein DMF63_11095 [Acidobacteriota bacterium]